LVLPVALGTACERTYTLEIPNVARVEVSPEAATLRLGDSLRVTAVALDDRARPLSHTRRLPVWQTSDALVVRLGTRASSGTGIAVWAHAERAGTAILQAESGGRRDSVAVTVR
jgi:hypothetical protein